MFAKLSAARAGAERMGRERGFGGDWMSSEDGSPDALSFEAVERALQVDAEAVDTVVEMDGEGTNADDGKYSSK